MPPENSWGIIFFGISGNNCQFHCPTTKLGIIMCNSFGAHSALPGFHAFWKPPNVGAGACGIWGHREEAQRPLHETMRLAEARLERHAPGGSMPSEAPKHCKIQSRRDAPKMAILEAPCAQNAPGRSTMRPPEALLPRNPTWESPHFSGLTFAWGFIQKKAVIDAASFSQSHLKVSSHHGIKTHPSEKTLSRGC